MPSAAPVPHSPAVARVIALQSAAGNAAVSRMLSGGEASQVARAGMAGGGAPLDERVRDRFEPAYGADLSDVRVHTGGEAAGAAAALDARAYTVGGDIVFNQGEYSPGTEGGQSLIAHELAHVVQQGTGGGVPEQLEVSQPGDAIERDADAAASAAMRGAPAAVSAAPPGAARKRIARFAQGTTRIEDGQYLGGTGHAAMTEEALHAMGLDPQAARAGRQGNWMRDLSQALTPGILVKIGGADRIFAILNVLSIKEFGRGFTAGEFGTYDPVEHIDNPTDLRASDVNRQVAPGTDGAAALADPTNPDAYRTTADVLANPAGTENQGYAAVDPRYAATPGANMTPGETTAAFQVNEQAIPRYMNTSKEWLKGKMHQAARAGSSGQGGLGPREFASGIHTMQDYYAHSNFCEIAINLLLREGAEVFVPAGAAPMGHPEETPGAVQRLNAAQVGVLDTMTHATDAQGNPLAANMMVNGLEVMTTGSFNMTDTAASLLEEAADKLKELNPFEKGKKGPSEVTLAALDYMEMDPENPADFSGVGQWVAEKIRSINTVVTAVTDTGAEITEGAGELVGSGITDAASTAGGVFGVMSSINEALGGSADYWDEEQQAVEGAGAAAAGAVTGLTGEAAAAIRSISESIEAYAADWADDQHSLRKAYTWVYEHGPLKLLKEAAKAIPVVGEEIAEGIEAVDKEIRDYLEEKLGEAWNQTVTVAMQFLNAAIEADPRGDRHRREAPPAGGRPDGPGDQGARRRRRPLRERAAPGRHRALDLPAAEPHADRQGPRRHRQPGERRARRRAGQPRSRRPRRGRRRRGARGRRARPHAHLQLPRSAGGRDGHQGVARRRPDGVGGLERGRRGRTALGADARGDRPQRRPLVQPPVDEHGGLARRLRGRAARAADRGDGLRAPVTRPCRALTRSTPARARSTRRPRSTSEGARAGRRRRSRSPRGTSGSSAPPPCWTSPPGRASSRGALPAASAP